MNQSVSTAQSNQVLFPVGRIVQGDLYEAQDKDTQGNDLVIKTGKNAGQKRVNFFFALAIPKTQPYWWAEEWGVKVYQLGAAAWPQGQAQQSVQYIASNQPHLSKFSWKIEDGDSQVPNENNRRNCDREGHPGHWIVKFGSMFATKIFDEQGQPLTQPGLVKRGYWVEVYGSVEGNGNAQKPGIYVNHQMVAYRAPGKEIVTGPDPRSVGFGRSALPAGVTPQPLGNTANMPNAAAMPPSAGSAPAYMPPGAAPAPAPGFIPPPGAPGATVPPAAGAIPPSIGVPAVGGAAPAPVAVAPHPGFIQPPTATAQPPVPPMHAAGVPGQVSPPAAPGLPPTTAPIAAPPAPVAAYVDPLGAPAGHRMVNAAGARYEQYRAGGWSDAQMLAQNVMVRL